MCFIARFGNVFVTAISMTRTEDGTNVAWYKPLF